LVRENPTHGQAEHEGTKRQPHRQHCCPRLHWLEPPALAACAYDSHHLPIEAGPHPSWIQEADRHWRALFGREQVWGGACAVCHVRADDNGRKGPAGRFTSPGDTAGGCGRPQGGSIKHTRAQVSTEWKAAQRKECVTLSATWIEASTKRSRTTRRVRLSTCLAMRPLRQSKPRNPKRASLARQSARRLRQKHPAQPGGATKYTPQQQGVKPPHDARHRSATSAGRASRRERRSTCLAMRLLRRRKPHNLKGASLARHSARRLRQKNPA